MQDDIKYESTDSTQTDEESTGNAALDKRLASGVLKGDSGTDTAQVWISAFLIAALGFVVYLGSFSVPLQGDDLRLFHDSEALQRIVTAPEATTLLPGAPLSVIGLSVGAALTGGGVDGLHGFNILLHLCCAVLVFLLARRLLPSEVPEVLAMLAGMLFAAHPLATGTVNYLAAYPVLQSSLFGLVAVVLLLRGASQSNFCVGSLAGAVLGFALAFGSDTSALLFPIVGLALIQFRHGGGENRNYARVSAPLLVLLTAVFWIAGRASGVLDATRAEGGIGGALGALLDLSGNLLLASVWPFNQPVLPVEPGVVAGGLGLILLLAGFGIGLRLRMPVLAFAASWISISLLSIACYGPAAWVSAYRYVYLPFAGVALLLPWAILQFRTPSLHRIAGGVGALLVLVLGVLSFQRTETWKQPVELWSEEEARHPESVEPLQVIARFQTAVAMLAPGENVREQEDLFNAAAGAWKKVLDRAPDNLDAAKYYGIMTASAGKFAEARPMLESAAAGLPGDQEVALYLGHVLEQMARDGAAREDVIGALRAYRRAAQLGPLPKEAQGRYGMIAASFGDLETALPLLHAATEGDENSPFKAAYQQFTAMAEQMQTLNTRAETALNENPGSVDGLLARSERMLIEGKAMSAFYLLEAIMEQAPSHDGTWSTLGLVCARIGGSENFLAEWGASRAGNSVAWEQLALRCAAGGAWDAAEAYLRYGIGQIPGAMPELKMAGIAQQLNQLPRVTTYLEAAQKAYPESPLPWLQQADVHIAAEDFARARGILDEAEKRGASAQELQTRRDKLGGGQGSIPAGIPRTVIR